MTAEQKRKARADKDRADYLARQERKRRKAEEAAMWAAEQKRREEEAKRLRAEAAHLAAEEAERGRQERLRAHRRREYEALRVLVETPRTAHLWSQPHTVTPMLVERVFGDGRLLVGVSPTFQRPWYYVVRGDSSWMRGLDEDVREHLADIYDAIEEQFGANNECRDDCPEDCDGSGHDEPAQWPIANFDGGCEWFTIDWPKPPPPKDALCADTAESGGCYHFRDGAERDECRANCRMLQSRTERPKARGNGGAMWLAMALALAADIPTPETR